MDEDTRFPGREKEVALLLKLFGEVGFRLFSCILDYFSFGKSYVCLYFGIRKRILFLLFGLVEQRELEKVLLLKIL